MNHLVLWDNWHAQVNTNDQLLISMKIFRLNVFFFHLQTNYKKKTKTKTVVNAKRGEIEALQHVYGQSRTYIITHSYTSLSPSSVNF